MLTSNQNDMALGANISPEKRHVLIFAPWCYGHHPIYLSHLINYWCEHNLSGFLTVLVTPSFLEEHSDVVNLIPNNCRGTVQFFPIQTEEQRNLEIKSSGLDRAFQQYQLIWKYTAALKVNQGLILYFDSCQIPLVLGLKFPCPVSGIYYRPTFHYSQFSRSQKLSRQERLQQWREKVFLYRIQQNPTFKTLFCLDPFAVEPINRLGRNRKATFLPDPVQLHSTLSNHADLAELQTLKQELGFLSGRRTFLTFGRLADSRKGIEQLVMAVSLLPDELCQQLCLLFVGEPDQTAQEQLESWLVPLQMRKPVHIVRKYGFLPESAVPSYFQLADAVMAPYQRHVGMSGILLQAAAAGVPVLSSDYGLMGELSRRYNLGLAIDSTKPEEIAKGLTRLLTEPLETIGDRAQMRLLVQQNSVEKFARTIFEHL